MSIAARTRAAAQFDGREPIVARRRTGPAGNERAGGAEIPGGPAPTVRHHRNGPYIDAQKAP